jgi:hypothetical protein
VNADGTGQLFGGWVEEQGTGWEELPEPFLDWVVAFPGVLDCCPSPKEDDGRTHLVIDLLDLPMPLDEPCLDSDYAFVALGLLQAQASPAGLPPMAVYTFGDRTVQQWEIDRVIDHSVDDLLRSICGLADPHAVALVRQVDPDGEAGRSLQIVVEYDGLRSTFSWPVDPVSGLPRVGQPSVGAIERVGDDQWIGVAATADIAVKWAPPPGGMGGPVGEA